MTTEALVLPDGGKARTCWRCDTAFVCGPRGGAEHCWCSALPPILPMTAGLSCLCPRCLAIEVSHQQQAAIEPAAPDQPAAAGPTLTEGVDYYLEGTAFVFTAAYHLRRGTCCGNGCRHCPYNG